LLHIKKAWLLAAVARRSSLLFLPNRERIGEIAETLMHYGYRRITVADPASIKVCTRKKYYHQSNGDR
jgi:hypothetical protein